MLFHFFRPFPAFMMVFLLCLLTFLSTVTSFNIASFRSRMKMVDDNMFNTYDELAQRLFTTYRGACERNPNPRQYWLCIAGGPG